MGGRKGGRAEGCCLLLLPQQAAATPALVSDQLLLHTLRARTHARAPSAPPGAVDFLLLAGFQRDASGEGLEMPADKVGRSGRRCTRRLARTRVHACGRPSRLPAPGAPSRSPPPPRESPIPSPPPTPPPPHCSQQVDRLVLEVAGEQLNSAINNPFFGML